LFTAVPLFLPFPPLEVSVHISLTSSINLYSQETAIMDKSEMKI
jgi:hypothetical protein